MTTTQRTGLQQIAAEIVSTIKEAGAVAPFGAVQGVPAGVLYAALMTHGCSLEQFEQIMAALESLKMVRKSGQLYYAI